MQVYPESIHRAPGTGIIMVSKSRQGACPLLWRWSCGWIQKGGTLLHRELRWRYLLQARKKPHWGSSTGRTVVFYTCEKACAKARGHVGSWPFQRTAAPVMRGGGCRGWPGQTPEGSDGHVKESCLTSNEKPLQSLEWLDLGFERCLRQNRGGRATREGTGMTVKRLVCSPCKRQKPLGWARMVAVGRRRYTGLRNT